MFHVQCVPQKKSVSFQTNHTQKKVDRYDNQIVYQTKSIIQENEEKKPPKKYLHSQMGEKKTTYAFNYKKKKYLE